MEGRMAAGFLGLENLTPALSIFTLISTQLLKSWPGHSNTFTHHTKIHANLSHGM